MKKTGKIAYIGVMTALAVAISALEGVFAPVMPVGAKPGLSNIVTMYCAKTLGLPYAVAIAAVKSLFVLATRGVTAFWMSLAGGVVSALVMALFIKNGKSRLGYIGIGIIGALSHNAMQLLVSCLMLGTAVLYYAPALIAFALVSGAVTGTILYVTLNIIIKKTPGGNGADGGRKDTDSI